MARRRPALGLRSTPILQWMINVCGVLARVCFAVRWTGGGAFCVRAAYVCGLRSLRFDYPVNRGRRRLYTWREAWESVEVWWDGDDPTGPREDAVEAR